MNTLFIVLGLIVVAWFLYSWLPVRSIEEPKYEVLEARDGYEIREYATYIIAETSVTGAKDRSDAASKGFPIVAGYIFGDNTTKDKIAMTAPVNTEQEFSEKIAMTVPVNTEQEEDGNTYNISFVLPSKYSLETLPDPNDDRVRIKEIPARKVAVKEFSWSTLESTFKKQEAELLAALSRDGVETTGQVNVARYNTPWTIPFMLRSEIQIEVR